MAGVIDGNVLPIMKCRPGDRQGRASLARAIYGVENLLLRATAVVMGPKYIGITTTGYNSDPATE